LPWNVGAPTPFSMSLTKKLVLAFLLVTMVPLGAIIGVLHYTFVEHAEGQVGARLEDSVIERGKSVDEFMFSCIRGMKDLAEDSALSSGDRDITHKQLSRYVHSFPYYGVLGTSERKVRLSHRQLLLRRCTSYSWSAIGLRNGRSSPRATVSGIANEYRPNMFMWSWISGESLATSASQTWCPSRRN